MRRQPHARRRADLRDGRRNDLVLEMRYLADGSAGIDQVVCEFAAVAVRDRYHHDVRVEFIGQGYFRHFRQALAENIDVLACRAAEPVEVHLLEEVLFLGGAIGPGPVPFWADGTEFRQQAGQPGAATLPKNNFQISGLRENVP